MHKLQITITNPAGEVQHDQLHTAPASWVEMTKAHLLYFAAILGSGLPVEDARLQLCAWLYKIPVKYFKYIPGSDMEKVKESLNFLLKQNKLYTWLLPSFTHRLFKYYGPKDKLANMTIQEFDLCELCFEKYQATANIEYLETLAAILFRPRRYFNIDDDIRIKLTTYSYVKRAKRFKKLPEALKYAIFLNYEGARNFIHQKYPDVFTKGKKLTKKTEITPWSKIIEASSNDIFGTMPQTESTNLHKFLSRLGTRIVEARELEKK